MRAKSSLRALAFFAPLHLALCLLVSACAITRTEPITRLALLAPFEGRYREVGYEALHAARLAISESGRTDIELLPVDDGGIPNAAPDRALALAQDPQVIAAFVLGYSASAPDTLRAFDDLPVIVIGYWGEPYLDVTAAARREAPFTCNQVCALTQFAQLRTAYGLPLTDINIESSGLLPDADFSERYRSSAPFTSEPGLIATATYDAVRAFVETGQMITPQNHLYQYTRDGELVIRPG